MKRTVTLIAFTLIVSYAHSQSDYHFDYLEMELVEITSPSVKGHYLGEEIAKKMQLLRESYTYKVYNDLKQVDEKVIEKQSIFFSVNKTSKYLKKQIKSGNLTKDEAKETMDKVLLVALNIRYQETEELESELFKIKDPKEIATLFTDRIVINI